MLPFAKNNEVYGVRSDSNGYPFLSRPPSEQVYCSLWCVILSAGAVFVLSDILEGMEQVGSVKYGTCAKVGKRQEFVSILGGKPVYLCEQGTLLTQSLDC